VQSEPLTDAEFERLSGILGRFDNKQPMNLEQLDGFLAALICGPEIVRPSEYLPVIYGSDMVLEDSFGSQSVLQDFLSLIMRHWNVIADTLHSGDVFLPLLLEDENGISHANDWAKASYVEWSSAKQSGLLFWMTKSTAVRSYQFLHWRTSMTQTPPCDLTNSQLVQKKGKVDYWCRRRCDEYLQIFSKAENSGRISRQRRDSPLHHTQNRAQ
jgi:Uncharacterised protein family (UPF0149)